MLFDLCVLVEVWCTRHAVFLRPKTKLSLKMLLFLPTAITALNA